MYRRILKPLLFLMSAETAHGVVAVFLRILGVFPPLMRLVGSSYRIRHPKLEVEVAGLKFPSPVGLAAGFDKDAKLFREMGAFGFGFIEVGTVTPRPQGGNPKPRLFRLPGDQALINRMGFNNEGVEAMARRLERGKKNGLIIGGNIGKNKDTPNEAADSDYLTCFHRLHGCVDYFVINISSPNTPGLRALQERQPLEQLLDKIMQANLEKAVPKPVFLKIAPDLTPEQADEIVSVAELKKLNGLIVSNTTISREGLRTGSSEVEQLGAGGLSGAPLFDKSTALLKHIAGRSNGKLALIASGGVMTAEQALEKLRAGASLVQLYTGFIYSGPGLVKNIHKSIIKS